MDTYVRSAETACATHLRGAGNVSGADGGGRGDGRGDRGRYEGVVLRGKYLLKKV